MNVCVYYILIFSSSVAFMINAFDIEVAEGYSAIIELVKIFDNNTSYQIKCPLYGFVIDQRDDCYSPHMKLIKNSNGVLKLLLANITIESNGMYHLIRTEVVGKETVELIDDSISTNVIWGELTFSLSVKSCECRRGFEYPGTYQLVFYCDLPTTSNRIYWIEKSSLTTTTDSKSSKLYGNNSINYYRGLKRRTVLKVNLTLENNTRNYELHWTYENKLRTYKSWKPIVTKIIFTTININDTFELKCANKMVIFRRFNDSVWTYFLISDDKLIIDRIRSEHFGIYACPTDGFSNIIALNHNSSPIADDASNTTDLSDLPSITTAAIPLFNVLVWVMIVTMAISIIFMIYKCVDFNKNP